MTKRAKPVLVAVALAILAGWQLVADPASFLRRFSKAATSYRATARLEPGQGLSVLPAVAVEKVKIGTATRSSFQVPPEGLELDLAAPSTLLEWSVGIRSAPGQTRGARFVMEVQGASNWKMVWAAKLHAADATVEPRWEDHRLDLGDNANGLRIRLRVESLPGNGDPVQAYWGALVALERASGDRPRPNVILISLDTLSADHLASFGGPTGASRAIDRFLKQSFSFRRAFVQYPNTLSSHASMFTGNYPKNHRVFGPTPAQPQDTLAEVFSRNGYRTAAFTEDAFVGSIFGFDKGFDAYDDGQNGVFDGHARAVTGIAARTFDGGQRWLEANGAVGPFFLFLHTYEVHTPYRVVGRKARAIVRREFPDESGSPRYEYPAGLIELAHNAGTRIVPKRDLDRIRALYAGKIHNVDAVFRRFLRFFRKLPFAEDTLIVLTSDHGDEFGEHGKLGHGETLNQAVLHVPLAFYWPGRISRGESSTIAESVDIAPTILGLLGVPAPGRMDGESLVSVLQGVAEKDTTSPAFAELRYTGFRDEDFKGKDCTTVGQESVCELGLYSVRTDRFHLIRSASEETEMFFDVIEDPKEMTDAAHRFPDELAAHREVLDEYIRNVRTSPAVAPEATPEVDPETEQRLKALGYLQ